MSLVTRTNESPGQSAGFFIGLRRDRFKLKSFADEERRSRTKLALVLVEHRREEAEGRCLVTRTIRNFEPEKGSFLSVKFGF